MLKTAALSLSLVAGTLIVGCANEKPAGVRLSEEAVSGVEETRAEVVSGQRTLNDALASMTALRAQASSTPLEAYKRFDADVDRVVKAAQRADARFADMRQRSRAYLEAWGVQAQALQTEDLRQAAARRQATAQDRYDDMLDEFEDVRDDYNAFIVKLKDLRTYLATDLTPAGIGAANDTFETVRKDGADLNEELDDLIESLDRVADAWGPSRRTDR